MGYVQHNSILNFTVYNTLHRRALRQFNGGTMAMIPILSSFNAHGLHNYLYSAQDGEMCCGAVQECTVQPERWP